MTTTVYQKLHAYGNSCLRRIIGVRWPDTIRNEELGPGAGLSPVGVVVGSQNWKLIGQIFRIGNKRIAGYTVEFTFPKWSPAKQMRVYPFLTIAARSLAHDALVNSLNGE